MPDPADRTEYDRLFHERVSIEGFGLDTAMVTPCPFCAAAGFMRYKVLEVKQAMAAGATCKECQRSARAIFSAKPSGSAFEIVQTGGPDQPAWLEPKMRRVGG